MGVERCRGQRYVDRARTLMARLPQVGADEGNWGNILNDFLRQSHSDDGTLVPGSVGASQLVPDAVTSSAIGSGQVTNAKISVGAVGTPQIADLAVTPAKTSGFGQPGGYATLDESGYLPDAQLPNRLDADSLATSISDAAVDSAQSIRLRLATSAGYDAARSNGFAQSGQAAASSFTEAWTDLSGWAGTNVQVSAGRAYGTTGAGGINHAFRVPPGSVARAVFKVNFVSGAASGQGVLVGLSRTTVGAAPATGGGTSRGLYFRSDGASSGVLNPISDGVQASSIFSGLGTSTWFVTVTVDENYYAISATAESGGKPRTLYRWSRDDVSYPLNNLTIMINDARGTSGSSVEAITEARIGAIATGKVSTGGISGHRGSVDGDNFLILTPASYDSSRPSPAIIAFHGNGSDETHWISNSNGKAVADAFLAAGFVVIAAANTGSVSTWGADAGLDAYTRAYQYARDHYNIGAIVFYANSMGSIESLNVLARDAIPGVSAWIGTVPTYDLAENYANPLFTSTIDAAYGGSYVVNGAGHDPARINPLKFRGIPMWMLIATDDTSVTPSANGQALYLATAQTNERTKVEVTGGHSTGQIASQANAMTTWAAKVIGHRATWSP